MNTRGHRNNNNKHPIETIGGGNAKPYQQNFISGQVLQSTPKPIVQPPLKQQLQKSLQQQPPQLQQQPPPQQQQQQIEQQESKDNILIQEQIKSETNNSDNVLFKKKIGLIRKKASVRAKEKKARQNRRLRKVLVPKNALMALHEIKGIQLSEFTVNNQNNNFIASVLVNNVRYEGQGISKIQAKNNASEKALRDLIISKLVKSQKNVTSTSDTDVSPHDDVEMKNTNETQESNKIDEDQEMEDGDSEDIPMLNLASFALFKLFNEWKNDGYQIPEFKTTSTSGNNGTPQIENEDGKKLPAPKAELPTNAPTMHPAMLLSIMRPGIQYTDLGSTGSPPNMIHTVGINIDGQQFVGCGRSKKLARKVAARDACTAIYGVIFENLNDES